MQPTDELYQRQSLFATLALPIVAIIMNFLTQIIDFMTPVDRSHSRRPSLGSASLLSRPKAQKCILVTGCDRGFGHEIAKRLDELGFSVIAACLDATSDSVQKLQESTSKRLQVLQLDVTKESDLKNATEWMTNNLGGKVLWGIVNNAGICYVGTPEIMGYDEMNRIIDVNLKGTVNVTRAFLPFVRKSRGRVVNMGSINGEVPMPFFSIYCATKAAIRMFTETLAYELQEWGVNVSLVTPSGYKTGIIMYDRSKMAEKWWSEAHQLVQEDYGREYFDMPMRVSGRIRVCEDYTAVIESVVHALTSNEPKSIYRAGNGSSMLPAICRFMPSLVTTYLCGSLLNFISAIPNALRGKHED